MNLKILAKSSKTSAVFSVEFLFEPNRTKNKEIRAKKSQTI
jgi:hypothetical protein